MLGVRAVILCKSKTAPTTHIGALKEAFPNPKVGLWDWWWMWGGHALPRYYHPHTGEGPKRRPSQNKSVGCGGGACNGKSGGRVSKEVEGTDIIQVFINKKIKRHCFRVCECCCVKNTIKKHWKL